MARIVFILLAVVSTVTSMTDEDMSFSIPHRIVKAGSTFTAVCEVPVKFHPFTMRIIINGTEQNLTPVTVSASELLIFNARTLTVEDSGNYTCEVTQGGQSFSKSFSLVVFKGVDLSNVAAAQFVNASEAEGKIECFVPGGVASWRFSNGTRIQTGEKYTTGESALTIKSLSKLDARNYTCSGSSTFTGSGDSHIEDEMNKTITLVVNYPPEFTFPFVNVTQDHHAVVTLTCDADAVPAPTSFTWFRHDTPIDSSSKDMESCSGQTCTFKFTEDLIHESFKCEAENFLGRATKTFTIIEGITVPLIFTPLSGSAIPQIIGTSTDRPIAAACSLSSVGIVVLSAISFAFLLF